MLDADVGPGAEVVDRIEDATSDPAIGRTCAEIAVLLEGPAGEAEKARGFRRAQEARRQICGYIGQVMAPADGGGRRRKCTARSGWVDRKSVGEGKSVAERLRFCGGRGL